MNDQSKSFCSSKNVIARRNQDGTVILMRLDETSFFYKLDGIAAEIWHELGSSKTIQGLINHFSTLYSGQKQELQQDISSLIQKLVGFQLIVESQETPDSSFGAISSPSKPYRFGCVKEYNLEQVEAEVLNESIYLDVFAGSDLRLKTDIHPIQNALSKVIQLEGITYHWDPDKAPESIAINPNATHAGLIAQDVAAQMPELVRTDRDTGYLAIEYRKLTAYLVEAIKDLHRVTLAQEERIKQLEARK